MQTLGFSDKAAKIMFTSAAWMSILIVLAIFLFIGKETFGFFGADAPGFSGLFFADDGTAAEWRPVSPKENQYGIIPLMMGSFLVTFMAILISIPFGVVGAVYLSELASPLEREIVKPFIELLAGIPSVVIGFFGLIVLNPILKEVFDLNTGQTALSGAILLAIMALPTILTVSEDAVRNVPSAYKQASIALGASRMQTIWKVTVPAALSGIVAATMLGIGRVVGETMTVLMVTGNSPLSTLNPFNSVRTMTATIAAEMGETPAGSDHYHSLFVVGIVLLIATFGLNFIAQQVLKKYGGTRE